MVELDSLENLSRMCQDALQAQKEAIAQLDRVSAYISGHLEEAASGKISYDHAKYVMAKKLAEIKKSGLYKAKGYSNVAAWAAKEFNLFGFKEQTLRNMAVLGRRPHILALEHRGVAFSCALKLAGLRQDQLPPNPETMIQHEIDAYIKQIREAERNERLKQLKEDLARDYLL